MKSSPNLNVLNLVLLGYVIAILNTVPFGLITHWHIPNIILMVSYFLLLAIMFRIFDYLVLILTSFTFLTLFFAFIQYHGISTNTILSTWSLNLKPINLFSYLLLPSLFLTYTLNFFLLSEEVGKIGKRGLLRFFIPVLVKRELILHRYIKIMETLWIKGYNTKGFFARIKLLSFWIIPLIVTTLMEGAESFEYNKMLNTKISQYVPSYRTYKTTLLQKSITILLTIIIFSLLIYKLCVK